MYSFVLTCDYLFIGEECYAAGAKVTRNPFMIASLATEEITKILCLALLFVGALLMAIKFDFVGFMKW